MNSKKVKKVKSLRAVSQNNEKLEKSAKLGLKTSQKCSTIAKLTSIRAKNKSIGKKKSER